jgi:glycerol-3-phosphate acyltransferase PlsY
MSAHQAWQTASIGQALGLVLVALVAYAYGSIPFAYLAAYLLRRKTLTEEGTGNVGVVNAYRAGGTAAVVLTLLGDYSKILVSVGLAELLYPGQVYVKLLAILAAFVGSNFSVFLRGGGGRGSTVLMWSLAVVSLWSCLVMLAILGACYLLARVDVRIKSLWYWFLPAVLFLAERDWVFLIFGILVVAIIYVKGRRSLDDMIYFGYAPNKQGSRESHPNDRPADDLSHRSTK